MRVVAIFPAYRFIPKMGIFVPNLGMKQPKIFLIKAHNPLDSSVVNKHIL